MQKPLPVPPRPVNLDSSFEIRFTENGFEWRYLGLEDQPIINEMTLTVFEKAILARIRTRNYNYLQFAENPDKWFSFRFKLDQLDF